MDYLMNTRLDMGKVLDRLDRLSPWAFTGILYILRWMVIIPLAFVLTLFTTSSQAVEFQGAPLGLFIGFIFLAPLGETLIECALPYWVMLKFNKIPLGKRPWLFVAISAGIMALLHIEAWPLALPPSLMTGAFLAYTYAHFAPRGFGRALLHTSLFHAAINIIGWFLIVGSM